MRLESDEPEHGNPSDQSLAIDINQLENGVQIDLVEAVLGSSQDIGGAEVDEEQTPVLLEEDRSGAETSFQENTTELLAYMGISTSTTGSSWGDILLDLCEPGDYMLPSRISSEIARLKCSTEENLRNRSMITSTATAGKVGRPTTYGLTMNGTLTPPRFTI